MPMRFFSPGQAFWSTSSLSFESLSLNSTNRDSLKKHTPYRQRALVNNQRAEANKKRMQPSNERVEPNKQRIKQKNKRMKPKRHARGELDNQWKKPNNLWTQTSKWSAEHCRQTLEPSRHKTHVATIFFSMLFKFIHLVQQLFEEIRVYPSRMATRFLFVHLQKLLTSLFIGKQATNDNSSLTFFAK